jgi:putative membrane protein
MNTIKKLTLNAAMLCLGLTLATSCNNSPAEESKDHAEDVNDKNLNNDQEKDADRIMKLHCANLFEIQASEKAAAQAVTADVKKLASMMVQAHTKMGADMQAMAERKSIALPAAMGDDLDRDMNKLNEKTGLDFDKEYLDQMKNKHDDAVNTLEKIADKSEDADIKGWASQSLPEIRSHVDMVESARNNIKDMKNDAKHDNHDGHTDHDHKDHDGHH